MNEDLLYALQQPPDPAFARTLHERLRVNDNVSPARRAWPVLPRLAAAAAVILVIGGVFSVPRVRAYADSFLALFRVVNFVAVPVSSNNVAALTSREIDLPRLIGEQVQVVQDPGAPLPVVSPAAASDAAGFQVAQPSFVPTGMTLDGINVRGASAVRVIGDAARLNDVLHALSITDIEVPAELTGQTAYVNVSPVVGMQYRTNGAAPGVLFLQSRPPEVQLPASIDLPRLGEVALRVLGLSADDAHRFAQRIDWSSTFLVPIPPTATSLRQIDVNGHQAIMVEQPPLRLPSGAVTRGQTMVLWSTGDRVFGLTMGTTGDTARQVLQQMADSIR